MFFSKKISRRRVLESAGALSLAKPVPILFSTPASAPPPPSGAFVTAVAFGSTAGGNWETNWEGMLITVGSSNLSVTALARWILLGNNQPHPLAIFDAASQLQITPNVGLTPPYSGAGFLYATLPSPVILQAGHQYYIVSQEYQTAPLDQLYQTDSSYITTSDATLVGPAYTTNTNNLPGTWVTGTGGSCLGPTNFQYTTTTAIASLAGSPFYPLPGTQQFGPGNFFVPPSVQVVSGTVILSCGIYQAGTEATPVNSVVGQWMIDNNPVGSYITGPPATGSAFAYSLDTTTLTDGTHSLWLRVIDTLSPGSDANFGAYIGKSSGCSLIVQNTGPKSGAQTVPVHSIYPDSVPRLLRPPADFVQYPGDTRRSVNTFSYPAPFAPPGYSTASPFNPSYSGTVLDGRDKNSYYVENTVKLRDLEYIGDTAFMSTPSGGVWTSAGPYADLSNSSDTAWSRVLGACVWDGGRYDNRLTPYCIFIADPNDTVGTPTGFIGVELNAHIFSLSYGGVITTLWGLTLNRNSFLPFDPEIVQGNIGSPGYTIPNLVARHSLVGSIGTPSFGQIGGTNCSIGGLTDIAYDPRDSTNNTIYATNIVTHIIIKITALKTSPVAVLFAGIEGSKGFVNGNVTGAPGNAQFSAPSSIIIDSSGNIYVADRDNCCIRKIDTSGNVTTLCGNQTGRPPSIVFGPPDAPPSVIVTYNESTLSAPQTGNTYGWSPSYAKFNGYISGTTLTIVGSITGATAGIAIGLPLNGTGITAGTFITAGSGTSWTVNNSQTVGSSGSPVAMQAGLIPTASAYVCYPVTLRFTSTGDIVFLEWGCNALRRIWLSGANSGNITRINIPSVAYAAGALSAFTWFDIDNPIYPIDYRSASPTAGMGTCGVVDDIIMIGFPEGNSNSTAARLSMDGSVNEIFAADGGTIIVQNGAPWLGGGTGFNTFPCALDEGPTGQVSDPFGVYTWVVAFAKRQARILTGGFRYWGVICWRVALPTDPNLINTNYFSLGQQLHRAGSTLCFPWGIKPSLDYIHGRNGFSHLGSDVGPTHHDLCVVYNGGDAQWHNTNTNYSITSMTWNSTGGGQIVIVMAVATFVEQVGNFVFISGATNSGSLGNSAVNGQFKVISFTDNQHYTVNAQASSGQIGTIGGTPVISTGTGILAKYIIGGSHGTFPRPEFDVPPGHNWYENNDTVALLYHIMRNTTAGSFPTPTGLPTFNTSDYSTPKISNPSATRLSSTSIQVTWNTDKLSIGLAVAGSAGQQAQTYPYNCWSPLESGYSTTHSVVINQLPNSTPIHWSIIVKDWIGNSSYLPDQTI